MNDNVQAEMRQATAPDSEVRSSNDRPASYAPYHMGFKTLDSEIAVPSLPVRGKLPAWLCGTLFRIGPARFEIGSDRFRHWFDGHGMLHKFSFVDGRVGYANRYVRNEAFVQMGKTGRITRSGFATDPCRDVFRTGLVHQSLSGNPNVNAIMAGDVLMVMGEAPLSIAVDPDTLETGAEWPWYDDILLGVSGRPVPQHSTAHPHFDHATRDMVNCVTVFGRECRYELHRGPADGSWRKCFAKIPVDRPTYLHTFGLTDRYVVLAEYPLLRNVIAVKAHTTFFDHYSWEPELGTRFTVVSRATGKVVARVQGESILALHQINCFERSNEIIFDVPAYPQGRIIHDFYLDRRAAGEALSTSQVRRYRIPLSGGDASSELLMDVSAELPTIDYCNKNGRDYATAFAVATDSNSPGGFYDRLVRLNIANREVQTWNETGCYPGEPVFVRNPSSTNERDGVILSVVLDSRTSRSFLLALNAGSFGEIARAETPHHIPFGFHGQFVT